MINKIYPFVDYNHWLKLLDAASWWSNQLKFNTIFFKKNVKKDNFLDALATKNSLRILPDEMRESFSQYVLKVINEASNAE